MQFFHVIHKLQRIPLWILCWSASVWMSPFPILLNVQKRMQIRIFSVHFDMRHTGWGLVVTLATDYVPRSLLPEVWNIQYFWNADQVWLGLWSCGFWRRVVLWADTDVRRNMLLPSSGVYGVAKFIFIAETSKLTKVANYPMIAWYDR
jgi:hypothetical protein